MKPQIKPGSRAEIEAARGELMAWLEGKPYDVRAIGASILGGLMAAQLGYVPHPKIIEHLREDIARLACLRSARKPENVNDINDAVPHGR